MGKPFPSHFVCVNTHPSLTSRVWAGCPSFLPGRPIVSFFTTGIPVPSICTYRIGTGSPTTIGRSNCTARWISSRSRPAMSSPIGFGRPLHGFRGHLQTGEQLHLLAAMIEGSFLAHDCLHAAHSRRKLRVFDVQFDVGGELASATVCAQVVGTRHFPSADCGENGLGTYSTGRCRRTFSLTVFSSVPSSWSGWS